MEKGKGEEQGTMVGRRRSSVGKKKPRLGKGGLGREMKREGKEGEEVMKDINHKRIH